MRWLTREKLLGKAILLLVCFATAKLHAQENIENTLILTIEDVVAQAINRNLSLRGNVLDVESARQNKNTSFRAFYPQVSANAGLSIFNEDPPGAIPQNQFSADISARLVFQGRVINDIQIALLEYEAGQISYQQAARELERSTRSLFYTLLLLEENIHLAEESVRIAEDRASETQIRFDTGLVDEYTLLTAQVNIVNAQASLEEIHKQYRDSIRQLNLLLNNDINQSIMIVGEIEPDIFTLDTERVIAELMPLSPSIQSLRIAVELMRKNRAVNTANFFPSLAFGYQFSQTYANDIISDNSGFGEADNWNTGGGFTMTISIPLSNLLPFSQTWIQQNILSRSVEKAELNLEERRKSMEIEIRSLIDSLSLIGRSIEAKRLNIQRAERAFAVSEAGYRVGLRNILEVRDAQNQLDNAKIIYLNERFNYIATQINLSSQLGVSTNLLREYALSEFEEQVDQTTNRKNN